MNLTNNLCVIIIILKRFILEGWDHDIKVNVHETIFISHDSLLINLIVFFAHNFLKVIELSFQYQMIVETHHEIIEPEKVLSEKANIVSQVERYYI